MRLYYGWKLYAASYDRSRAQVITVMYYNIDDYLYKIRYINCNFDKLIVDHFYYTINNNYYGIIVITFLLN